MDSHQAREILQFYRPGVDDDDPQFAEALAQAQRDPELRAWLDTHGALYTAIREKIKDIPVPVELQEQLLAERSPRSERGKVVRPTAWWRSPIALGAAALLVIGFSIYSIINQLHPPVRFATFRQQMAEFAASGYEMEVKSDSLDELRQQFARNGWPSDYVIPAGVSKLKVNGGCMVNWRERKVSMLCLSGPDHKGVWLFVAPERGLRDSPEQSTPQITTISGIATASWTDGGKTYILAAGGGEAVLRALL